VYDIPDHKMNRVGCNFHCAYNLSISDCARSYLMVYSTSIILFYDPFVLSLSSENCGSVAHSATTRSYLADINQNRTAFQVRPIPFVSIEVAQVLRCAQEHFKPAVLLQGEFG